MKQLKCATLCAVALLICIGYVRAGTVTAIDYPGARSTSAIGISGNNIVGFYVDSSGQHSFLYNGTSYAKLDYPGATGTYAEGINGNNIVGNYYDSFGNVHGFLYNGTNPSVPE